MFAKLTALVGGGYSFPYNVEEPFDSAWGQWTHHPGTSKEDGSPVSVFRMSSADPNDRRLAIARNGVKRLKLLRHPNILAFKDSAEVQEKGQTVIYLVTQAVKPVKMVLQELNLSGQHRDEYYAMGILHMTNAVSFLNNDCKLIHGNICLDSVVVTESLDWKLHGFDLLSEHSLPGDHCLMHASWMVGNQYKPAELGKSEWDVVRDSPPWAIDAWGLGCLIQEVFSLETLQSVENLRRTSVIPQALLSDYQKLLSSTPSRRLNPSKVAECKFLNNRLVDVVAFMENISVKDSMEKDSFFKRLGSAVPAIPLPVAELKILPLLSHALEFGGAPPSAVAPLLQIGNKLSSDDFNKRVVPTLSKLYASPDRTLRRGLLESIDSYAQHLTTAVLEEQIYVHLQSGFTDSNAYIRELTLKSILSLAPKLSNKTLVNNVLKHLSRLQVDEEASIRANTTVLLGNVSKYLGEATCKRVLINAFTRALKDAFPPAKIAGLRAMVATQEYHGPEDAALRILPAAVPLTIDPVAEVRSAALQVLDVFTNVLKESDARRAQEAAASTDQAFGSGGMGSRGSTTSSASPALAAGSSMLTWAVSSLMSSTGLAITPNAPAPAASAPSKPAGGLAPAAAAASSGPSSSAPASRPAPARPSSATSSNQDFHAASSDAGQEGWGDGDGWNDEELVVDDEEAKARSRLSSSTRGSAAKKAAPAAASAAARKSDGWDSGQQAGKDDDGWEGLETPAPAPVRPAATSRPAARSGSGAAGAKPKSGAMKLGVSKLGASKVGGSSSNLNFDEKDW